MGHAHDVSHDAKCAVREKERKQKGKQWQPEGQKMSCTLCDEHLSAPHHAFLSENSAVKAAREQQLTVGFRGGEGQIEIRNPEAQ